MTRFIFTLAVLSLIIYLARRMIAPPLPPPEPERGRGGKGGGVPRGAPRALVCGECGTQFAPDTDGWTCPKCGT